MLGTHTDEVLEERLRLTAGHMLCIQDGPGVSISVLQGQIIATQEQDFDDILIRPGGTFRVQRAGKTIVIAHSESVVRLTLPAAGRAAQVVVKKYVGPRAVILRRFEKKWGTSPFF